MPPLFWWLLFRPGHPAVLFFGVIFQWTQCYMPVVSANNDGVAINEKYDGAPADIAVWFCYASLIVLSLGIHFYTKIGSKNKRAPTLSDQATQLSLKRLFYFYFIGLVLSVLIVAVSARAGALRQPILAFATIKSLPVFLILWTTLQRRKDLSYMLIVLGIEILIGFTGYFSAFKSTLFLAIIVGLGCYIDKKVSAVPIAIAFFLCLLLSSFWQTIKTDYRVFLNKGSNQQVIDVSISERLQFLAERALSVSTGDLMLGGESGMLRLGYIDYFAHALSNVQRNVPYQNGELWRGALEHTFMPRFFFPDKPIINESARTMQFTGITVAGMDEGTSISIGYPGESYIDFGIPVMFLPIFLLGIFYSFVYETLSHGRFSLAGAGMATAVLLEFVTNLGSSNIGIVGGLTTGLIAFKIFELYAVPKIWPLLCEPNTGIGSSQ